MWGNRKSIQEQGTSGDVSQPAPLEPIPVPAAAASPTSLTAPDHMASSVPVWQQAAVPATPMSSSPFPPAVGSAPAPADPGGQVGAAQPASPFPGSTAGAPLATTNAATRLGGGSRSGGQPDHGPDGDKPNRWLPLLLALAFLATAIVSFLLGRVSADSESASGAVGPRPVPTSESAPADPPDRPAADPGPVDAGSGEEPVVAVAEAVGPTVVQLVIGGPGGRTGLGSGFFYDDDGRILTNAHVVGDAETVLVRLASGTQVEGEVIGADDVSDVAVVQVDPADAVAPAALATNTEVKVGQLAVVLGSPFGLEQTVTSGIVSAINRPLRVDPTSDTPPQAMIQTDASINQGNSGGPLVDRQGRVIGINSAIFSRSGTADGVGFAIPIDRALDIADLLVRDIEIERGLLGVGGRNPVTGRAGALITQVSPGSGAEEGGIEVGDLIIRVDDRDIRSINDLGAVVRARRAGDEVQLEFVRDGVELQSTVTLGSE